MLSFTPVLSSSSMEIYHLNTYNLKRNLLLLSLFYTYSHSFLRACGVLWILCAWWAMMMSFCSTSPPRRRSMQWGLKDPDPWSDEPSSLPHGTSKLAARGGSSRYSGAVWGTWREQERTPCAKPGRRAGLDFLQASGSGRDREDWTCIPPLGPQLDGEWRLGVRERDRDWSDLVNISTEVGSWPFHHNATNGKQKDKRGNTEKWWMIRG